MSENCQTAGNEKPQAISLGNAGQGSQGSDGKFKPGQSGNPKGRPLGSRNRVRAHVRAFLEEKLDGLLYAAWANCSQNPKIALDLVKLVAGTDLSHPPEFKIGKVDSEAELDATVQRAVDAADAGTLSPSELNGVLATLERIRHAKGWDKPEVKTSQAG